MPPCVLVVDDEPNIVLSFEFLLKQVGYEVRVARDGEQALAEIALAKPDLVLLDVMMPKRDGYDVCRTIRASADWADMPVIMLTARGSDSDRRMGMDAGANEYITKPFSTRDVVEKVRHFLGVP
ncbi:response regulator transcription factor [Magnetospirillum aberrantis]|uniref:Response regulator n=1 Tax=Magnetospirillum aberrantis SpK TaxID=908842 RepID=A0A7C9QU84_9PROT|nr:response regulator [Magnetospirillum aberrantis]NFV80457.1 response regulator [Magnetospirillum aberrantis SpK]